ncbi:MAG: vWA domain-containing protein [Candidatus Rifleibacteriota bacterium]
MKKYSLLFLLLLIPLIQVFSADFSSKITSINAAGFPSIEIMLKIFNPEEQIINADHFAISEDSNPIKDFALTARMNTMYMTLIIDRSSSIKPAMNQVKKAAAQFIKSMAKHARISILSFASDLDYCHDFSQNVRSLIQSIVKIRPWGGTALYDALYSACEEIHMKAGRNDLKTVICLTDGRDSTPGGKSPFSTHSADEVISYAQKYKVRIITVGLGNNLNARLLKEFAEKTGGWYLQTASAQRLTELYAALSNRMKLEKYYSLTYTSPKPQPDDTTRIVQIHNELKGKKDQVQGKYTAPKRSVHIPQKEEKETKKNKFNLDKKTLEDIFEGNSYLDQSVDTELKELPLKEVIENELEDNSDLNEPAEKEVEEIPLIDIID